MKPYLRWADELIDVIALEFEDHPHTAELAAYTRATGSLKPMQDEVDALLLQSRTEFHVVAVVLNPFTLGFRLAFPVLA